MSHDIQLSEGSSNLLPKVIGFSVAMTLIFTLVANLLPQVEGEAPVDKEIDLSSLTPESFAALGETLFLGKGTCTLCHKPPPLGRAPDIQGEDMTQMAVERLADERYRGKADNVVNYILESMTEPSAYVVKDWGVPGSDDTVSPMPKADAAPIELSAVEMDAVIAYLQHKDGNEITVTLPTETPVSESENTTSAAAGTIVVAALSAEEAVKKYGCQACHSMLGTTSPVGPPLDKVGAKLDVEQIRESILEPAAVIAEGFTDIMPKDFAEKMTVKELGMIVALLTASDGDKATDTSEQLADEKSGTAEEETAEEETIEGAQ